MENRKKVLSLATDNKNKNIDTMKKLARQERKQFMFTFEGGGFNTVWAETKQEAIKAALKEYEDSDTLNVCIDSVHEATEEGVFVAMSNFY